MLWLVKELEEMEGIWRSIQQNPSKDSCVRRWDLNAKPAREEKWGASLIRLDPPRLVTAWLMETDPLMNGSRAYRSVEVRNTEFALQKEGTESIRGRRKLSKKAIGEALSSTNPTKDQLWVFAACLYELKQVQVVWWNDDEKRISTMPEDLRAWSTQRKTLWVSQDCSHMLQWDECDAPALGLFLSQREGEGWRIAWPEAEGTMEELKSYAATHAISVSAVLLGDKVKKSDYSRVVGRAQAVAHLSRVASCLGDGAGYLE